MPKTGSSPQRMPLLPRQDTSAEERPCASAWRKWRRRASGCPTRSGSSMSVTPTTSARSAPWRSTPSYATPASTSHRGPWQRPWPEGSNLPASCRCPRRCHSTAASLPQIASHAATRRSWQGRATPSSSSLAECAPHPEAVSFLQMMVMGWFPTKALSCFHVGASKGSNARRARRPSRTWDCHCMPPKGTFSAPACCCLR
mmetsp:Transcript_145095/g.404250  ORF Transcript_145095/g.404250 Transcript_145095/m.404250 type:complete len:200 (-) Transcript_145095:2332-2931(-)